MPLKAHQYCSDKSYETFKYYWSWVGSVHIMCVQVHSVAQSCLTLWDPTECSPPGSSVQGIFPARILEWVAISSSRGSSQPRGQTRVSCIASGLLHRRQILYLWTTREGHCTTYVGEIKSCNFMLLVKMTRTHASLHLSSCAEPAMIVVRLYSLYPFFLLWSLLSEHVLLRGLS